jgi:hypothetical protein
VTASSRDALPTQVLVQQPDQHHRQRDICRTNGAYSTVRHGARGLGGLLLLAAQFLVVGACTCFDLRCFFGSSSPLSQTLTHLHLRTQSLYKLAYHSTPLCLCLRCVGVARGVLRECTCSRGVCPQVLATQSDQQHRQRGLCRTGSAYSTVRRGGLWSRWSLCLLLCFCVEEGGGGGGGGWFIKA